MKKYKKLIGGGLVILVFVASEYLGLDAPLTVDVIAGIAGLFGIYYPKNE